MNSRREMVANGVGVECAVTALGAFAELAGMLIAKQDSIRLESWARLTREAGVTDTARIVSCAQASETATAIAAGIGIGSNGAHLAAVLKGAP